MKVIKVCINEWKNASRDKRELSVCQELGFDTMVMAKGGSGDKYVSDIVDGFSVMRFTTRPLSSFFPTAFNRILSLFLWAKWVRSFHADIITGHDIIAVCIGWISNFFNPNKAKLVYDSHEFEPGRNTHRSKIATFLIMKLEKFLMKRCEFTIIPCDSAADELVRLYGLKKRPVVVRSIPDYLTIDYEEVRRKREDFEKYFGNQIRTIAMYHGGVMENRGLLEIVEAISELPDVGLVILGEIMGEGYYKQLLDTIREHQLENRVLFHDAVPHSELYKYVSAADIGMAVIIPKTKSYYYALPNKLFENIQSCTPLIVSNLPEMRRIIEKYQIGTIVDEADVLSIREAITELGSNNELRSKMERNLLEAKKELCWEKEKKNLIKEYKGLIGNAKQ